MRENFGRQLRALGRSFGYALRGIRFCVKNERNMRIHLAAAVFVTAFSLVYRLERGEYAALFLVMGAVIAFEAVNTALEALVNLASPAYHDLARIAKDAAAGAVLIAALAAVLVGVCLFGEPARLWETVLEILSVPLLAALFAALAAGGAWFVFYGNRLFKD